MYERYERIVKSLRFCMRLEEPAFECIEMDGGCCDSIGRCIPHLMDEAADAIEVLDMKLHGANAAIAGMKREIERMVIDSVNSKPKWIPVTERLPEIDPKHHCSKDVLVRVEGGGYMFSALEENIFGQAWFECERMSPSGDDGYTVTHWMPFLPLPEDVE